MRDGLLIQILLIVYGSSMFIAALISLVRRKMSEVVVIPWGLGAVIFIILGIVVRPDGWRNYLSSNGLFLIIVFFVIASYAIYFFSIRITDTIKKTNQLAIQVSLLNTEVEELRKKIEVLENEKLKDEENSVRN